MITDPFLVFGLIGSQTQPILKFNWVVVLSSTFTSDILQYKPWLESPRSPLITHLNCTIGLIPTPWAGLEVASTQIYFLSIPPSASFI